MFKYIVFIFLFFNSFALSQANDTITSANQRTFKENTAKKYTNKDFNYEEKIQSENDLTLWEYIKKWLAEFFQRLFGLNSGSSMNFTGYFLNFLAFLIILIVVYFIAKALLNKEGMWLFSSKNKNLVGPSFLEENINEINFGKAIEKAKAEGQNRQVIRLYYLWVLKTFSDKGYIHWDKDKTNADYLNEIENQELKNDFAYLSYLFNYTWYGVVDIKSEDFLKMNESFEKTLKSIGS